LDYFEYDWFCVITCKQKFLETLSVRVIQKDDGFIVPPIINMIELTHREVKLPFHKNIILYGYLFPRAPLGNLLGI
jgi:hypothetical protein